MKCMVTWSSITRVMDVAHPTRSDVFVSLGEAPVPGVWYLPPRQWCQNGLACTDKPGIGAYLAVCTAHVPSDVALQEVVVLVQNGLLTHLVVIASPFDYAWAGKHDLLTRYRWAMVIGLRSERDAARWGELLSRVGVNPQQIPLASGSCIEIESHDGIGPEMQTPLRRALWNAFGLSDFPLFTDVDDPGRVLGSTWHPALETV